jgi:hypothetical protein
MRTLLILIAALALAACAAAGPAPETSAAAVVQGSAPAVAEAPLDGGGDAATAAPTKESPNDIICRNQRVTGSLRMRRVCHPRWEWTQMEDSATETMRDINSIPVPIKP